MADLAELLERVKAATGPNFALDWDIHLTVRGIWGAGMYGNHPAYTASLDAALALVERLGMDVQETMHEALEHLGRCGWRDDLPITPQMALAVLVVMLEEQCSAS